MKKSRFKAAKGPSPIAYQRAADHCGAEEHQAGIPVAEVCEKQGLIPVIDRAS